MFEGVQKGIFIVSLASGSGLILCPWQMFNRVLHFFNEAVGVHRTRVLELNSSAFDALELDL